ncbi:hypothetical protein A6J71_11885 [Enterobacter cancerogenus]|uniref:hypothetical protein n=1 Tax=Enterobacter TaxID=547 RepID=UPI000C9B2F43|nr:MULTISPECIES: hypothetical protein [Enterobacter]HCR2080167.1 hypothetical protein [Enterobacter kobei]MBW8246024.1 hypothetical protein [Enterobacter mori]MBW8250339.1 hypothetical protein [Enterobacter mori]PNF10800.1 hypothetical protein A6J71_11885 [Enterobacter cancerogenus]BBW27170.1 hypothetical protein STN0717ENT56_23260 [Enterobacter bugandensis]
MNILGVRAAPKVASFIVYNTESCQVHCSDVIRIPATLDIPEKLKYVRNNILDILRFYNVEVASIRVAESNSQNLNIERLYIEAVIQEAFSSSEVKKYITIRQNGIKSSLNLSQETYKAFLKSELTIHGIDNSNFNSETNEALLSALAAGARL